MNNKILFMIFKGGIKFLTNSNMDHREWYLSLGGDINDYDNVIRGYVIDNKIIFFKANLMYDQEVIDMACKCAPLMKQQLNNPYLTVCCGITPGMNGSEWEPILTLKDEEITNYNNKIIAQQNKEPVVVPKMNSELEPVLEFKNNYKDPKFIKFATIFSIVILVLTIIAKVILVNTKKIETTSGWNILLMILQVVLIILSIVGYLKKSDRTKYIGVMASASLFFMFDIFDIILGAINLFFTIDQGYILKLIDTGKNAKNAIGDKINQKK